MKYGGLSMRKKPLNKYSVNDLIKMYKSSDDPFMMSEILDILNNRLSEGFVDYLLGNG